MVAKTDDEIYILSIIKVYSQFLFVFSGANQYRVVQNIGSDVATLKFVTTMQKWYIRKE